MDAYQSLEPPKEPPVDEFLKSVGALQGDMKRAQEGSIDIARRKQAADQKTIAEAEQRTEQDRGIAIKHLEAQGIEAEKMKPWDAEKERDRHITAPLEAFGSYASIFAIAASAFTKTPAVNALSASAAAMNAIKANDEKEYKRAFDAYKENMDLVKKRFDMQHTQYGEALQLMEHDSNAGRQKLANTALKFGDEQTLLMLETGNDKGLIDLQNSRMKSMEESYKIGKTITEDTFRDQAFRQAEEANNQNKDPKITLDNWMYSRGIREPAQQKIFTDWMITPNLDGSHKTPEQGANFWRNLQNGSRTPKNAAYAAFIQETQDKEGRVPTSEESRAWEAEWDKATKTAGGNASTKTVARQAFTAATKARTGQDPTAEEYKAWEADYNESVKPKRELTLKEKQIQDIMNRPANRDEYGNPKLDRSQAEAVYQQEVLKPRGFSDQAVKQIAAVPTLLDSLEVLDAFSNAANPLTGVIATYGTRLGLGNDPQRIFDYAIADARQAASQWSGSSQRLKSQVETAMSQLPKVWNGAYYAKGRAQQTAHVVAEEVQRWLSVQENQKKTLDEGTLQQFMERGIYPTSAKDRDPITKLHNDPKTLTEDEFNRLRKHQTILSPPDRNVLRQEMERRQQEWEQEKLRNTPPVLGPR